MQGTRTRGTSRRAFVRTVGLGLAATSGIGTVAAGGPQRGNGKNNGNGDSVTGMYKSTYAYDANGDWYGYNMSNRELEAGTVSSIDELDASTLTTCYYKVQYGGSFGDDPYLDMGWIANHVVCKGYEPDNRNVLWVHETDPRYTGDGIPAFGGSWEVHVDSQRGDGNTVITDQVNPHSHR